MGKLVLIAALALSLALASVASAAPTTRSVARFVEHTAAARFVGGAHPHVQARCHRRGARRFKCHFSLSAGDSAFGGRVRVRLLHSGRVRLLWGEIHLGGFGPSCLSNPAFTVSQTPAGRVGTAPADGCGR